MNFHFFLMLKKLITNHSELIDYWKLIQDQLREEIELDPYVAMEIVGLIKILEKGYMASANDINIHIDYNHFKEYENKNDLFFA